MKKTVQKCKICEVQFENDDEQVRWSRIPNIGTKQYDFYVCYECDLVVRKIFGLKTW
jgi:hypothetical protein